MRGGGSIPPAIVPLFGPTRVEAGTVALDDEPAVDQEVDPADARDVRLRDKSAPQTSQHETDEGFGTGLGSWIEQATESSVAPRESREELIEVVFPKEPEMKGRVERCDREPRLLARHRVAESVEDLHTEGARMRSAGQSSPMHPHSGGRRRKPRRGRGDVDMEGRTVSNEHPAPSQLRDAGEPPPRLSGRDALLGRAGDAVRPLTKLDQLSREDGRRDIPPRRAVRQKVGCTDESRRRARVDSLRGHPATVPRSSLFRRRPRRVRGPIRPSAEVGRSRQRWQKQARSHPTPPPHVPAVNPPCFSHRAGGYRSACTRAGPDA